VRPLLDVQGLNIVQNNRRLQKGERVDFTHHAGVIDQKHLEHVMHGPPRAAIGGLFDAHVLAKVFEHRKQIAN
jgi:hypothetical protein